MDVEQIRDSLLAASGALDKKMGGPSEALTPQSTRRTLYGKVSRYKLDDFLQLLDFPSPNISAEQHYATNVPLQRLFFMNSDFVQQQAELLVRRIESEPTLDARIQKAYRLVFGRAATAEDVRLGLEYLRNEPLKEYEERKKAEEEKEKKKAEKKEMADKPGEGPPAAPSVIANQPDTPAMDRVRKAALVEYKPSHHRSGLETFSRIDHRRAFFWRHLWRGSRTRLSGSGSGRSHLDLKRTTQSPFDRRRATAPTQCL